MDITLVLCPCIWKRSPLIGLAYLLAYLKNKGHKVGVIDLNAEVNWPYDNNERIWQDGNSVDEFVSQNTELIESLAERILEQGSKVIGFSVWATTKYLSLAVASKIKEKDKEKLIIFGGPECSFSGKELIYNEAVDVVIYGEGEETLAEIGSLYEKNSDIDFCKGAFLKKEGQIIDCGYREEIKDLDTLPFPDYSAFDFLKYNQPDSLSITFYRGCIRRCAFCNTEVTWKKFRSKTAEYILKEMTFQITKYPTLHKLEVDDTALNLNINMLSQLCDMIIANGLKIYWGGSALIRPEMDTGLLKKMAKAGCNCIGYGLESGSQKIIDKIGKGFKISDAEKVIKGTYSSGIETILGIIIGFPGETEEDFHQTLDFIARNKEYISWVHSPSECCIGCNSYMQRHPAEFDAVVEINNDGHNWYSRNHLNTHEERQRRIKMFYEFLASINVKVHGYFDLHKNK